MNRQYSKRTDTGDKGSSEGDSEECKHLLQSSEDFVASDHSLTLTSSCATTAYKMPYKSGLTGLIALDFAALAIVGSVIIIFHFGVTPFHRGFYCGDQSISYPYHDSTISSLLLYLFGSISNITAMAIIEAVIYFKYNIKPVFKDRLDLCVAKVHPFIVQLYKVIAVFAFTCVTSQSLTDIGKYSIGRLRPHFLDVCKPDNKTVNCTSPTIYNVDFVCTGTDAHRLREGRLSFPSGHASFSAVTMVYLVLYLQARFNWGIAHLLRPFLQVTAYAIAFYTALSRVSDYKHHPTDVIAGHILGSAVAFFMVYALSDLFKMRNYNENIKESSRLNENANDVDTPI